MYFLLSGRFYTRGRNIRQYELGQTFLFRLVIVCRLLCVGQTFLFRVGQTFLFRLVILVIVCRCPPRRAQDALSVYLQLRVVQVRPD